MMNKALLALKLGSERTQFFISCKVLFLSAQGHPNKSEVGLPRNLVEKLWKLWLEKRKIIENQAKIVM